jgi:hypothetical protein
VPHAPQFAGSLRVSTQAPEQVLRPPVHAHWPATQRLAPVQAVPQAPQFARSLRVSTQAPPQLVRPVAHVVVQMPALQT